MALESSVASVSGGRRTLPEPGVHNLASYPDSISACIVVPLVKQEFKRAFPSMLDARIITEATYGLPLFVSVLFVTQVESWLK